MSRATREKEPTWTQTKADNARKLGKFIKANGDVGLLAPTGAVRRWTTSNDNGVAEHARDIYVGEPFFVVGTPEELRALNLKDADINRGFSLQNYETSGAQAYQMALQNYENAVKTKPKKSTRAASTITLGEDARKRMTGLHAVAAVNRPKKKAAARAPGSPSGNRGPKESPLTRYNSVRAMGALLDVSNAAPNGTGTKIEKKALGPKSTRVRPVADLAIISSKPEAWVNYIDLLSKEDPNFAQYRDAFARATNGAMPAAARAPSPMTRMPSPRQPSPRSVMPPVRAPSPRSVMPPVRAPSPRTVMPPVRAPSPRTAVPTARVPSPVRTVVPPSMAAGVTRSPARLPVVPTLAPRTGMPAVPKMAGMAPFPSAPVPSARAKTPVRQ